jgi:hypothetical protein
MALPAIVVAAAPYAGAIALTAARLAAAGFGLIAGMVAADKVFGFTKAARQEQEALIKAMTTPTTTTTDGDPVAVHPMPNGLDPHPAGQA